VPAFSYEMNHAQFEVRMPDQSLRTSRDDLQYLPTNAWSTGDTLATEVGANSARYAIATMTVTHDLRSYSSMSGLRVHRRCRQPSTSLGLRLIFVRITTCTSSCLRYLTRLIWSRWRGMPSMWRLQHLVRWGITDIGGPAVQRVYGQRTMG